MGVKGAKSGYIKLFLMYIVVFILRFFLLMNIKKKTTKNIITFSITFSAIIALILTINQLSEGKFGYIIVHIEFLAVFVLYFLFVLLLVAFLFAISMCEYAYDYKANLMLKKLDTQFKNEPKCKKSRERALNMREFSCYFYMHMQFIPIIFLAIFFAVAEINKIANTTRVEVIATIYTARILLWKKNGGDYRERIDLDFPDEKEDEIINNVTEDAEKGADEEMHRPISCGYFIDCRTVSELKKGTKSLQNKCILIPVEMRMNSACLRMNMNGFLRFGENNCIVKKAFK